MIDVLRRRNGRRELLAELVRAGHTLSTTALNIAEVYAGMRLGEIARTEAFLGELECHDLTGSGARLAGKLKNEWRQKGRTLTLAATVVAAVAMERKSVLPPPHPQHSPLPTDQP